MLEPFALCSQLPVLAVMIFGPLENFGHKLERRGKEQVSDVTLPFAALKEQSLPSGTVMVQD